MKFNGSIFIFLFINHQLTYGRTILRFLIEPDLPINDQEQLRMNQEKDKNEIMKKIEESNNYHRNMHELEFDYFNMLTSRMKKSSSIKNDNNESEKSDRLIRPPYMYSNYQQLTNDQSYDQFNDQLNNEFNGHQLANSDKLDSKNKDKMIKINKTEIDQSIDNKTLNDNKRKSSWFVKWLNKFGVKLNSNNPNTTLNVTAIKEKLNYYSDYDVMMGVRIAYWLFSLFTIFTLFIIYKSYCSQRKQERHRRESEKNRRKDEQGSRRKTLPPKLNSVRRSSGRMSKTFVKLKEGKELDSSNS